MKRTLAASGAAEKQDGREKLLDSMTWQMVARAEQEFEQKCGANPLSL